MRSLIAISFALLFCAPATAHHGPFGTNEDGSVHELHLGKVQTLGQDGRALIYGIRASSLEEFTLQKPWYAGWGCPGCATTPLTIKTNNVLGFGAYAFDIKNSGAAGAVVTGATALVAPLLLLPLALVEGETNISYQLVYADGDGDLVSKPIRLYSDRDVGIFNNYLKLATGIKPGQPISPERIADVNERKLKALEKDFQDALLLVASTVRGKPWCKRVLLTNNEESDDYRDALEKLNRQRVAMGLDKMTRSFSLVNQDEFEEYIDNSPRLKVWAEANPAAAEKFRSCPST